MRLLAVVAFLGMAAHGSSAQATPSASSAPGLEARAKSVADEFVGDIHAQKGMTCSACHQASDKSGKPIFYSIRRNQIPELCGSCHADSARIKQFNPSLRTDQLAQYRTSVHGIKLAHGDTRVAVCTDCHTTHSIHPASDSNSSVHPLNVATTCKRCHSDRDYMKPYHIPSDQFAAYTDSVHYNALVKEGDLSAPTCATCHGSHGAAPPGVMTAANVCVTCHVIQGKLFEESPHKLEFAQLEIPSCVTCHEHHRIRHPDDNFVGTGKSAVCGNCHITSEPAGKMADETHNNFRRLEAEITNAKLLLERAARNGMDVADAQMELTQANDALAKARVSLHSAKAARVAADLESGAKIVAQADAAGNAALKEHDNRRKVVAVPIVALLMLFVTAGLYVRVLERNERN